MTEPKATEIINAYCRAMGVTGLTKKRVRTWKREGNVSLSEMRHALTLFLSQNGMTYMSIAPLIGLKDRSTLCYTKKIILVRLEMKDEKFLSYYEKLMTVISGLESGTRPRRISTNVGIYDYEFQVA
jgi:hypothetical protein